MAIHPNPEVMEWAIQRSGIERQTILKEWPKFEQWLDGTWSPTVKQIRDFADKVHINVSALFSDTVPDLGLQIADFRTVNDSKMKNPSPELYDTINLMMRRQSWMREYFSYEGRQQISFIGSFTRQPLNSSTVQDLTAQLYNLLHLESDWAVNCKSTEDAFRLLKNRIEQTGISVVVNGVVNDNTHRPLKTEEFRGFVLSDAIAPLIFINGKDAKSAQIFTLIHELSHLAYSQTGVSNPSDNPESPESKVEHFCNSVAAEFLVPENWLRKEFSISDSNLYDKISHIARQAKVSFLVVARRVKDVGLINRNQFFDQYHQHQKREPIQKKSGSGGNYFNTKQYRLGNVFSDAILTAVNTGYIEYRDAYDLTGLNAVSFRKYFAGVE